MVQLHDYSESGVGLDRDRVMEPTKAGIEFRMITGGCFPNHVAMKSFDYDIFGNIDNAKTAHERGFSSVITHMRSPQSSIICAFRVLFSIAFLIL